MDLYRPPVLSGADDHPCATEDLPAWEELDGRAWRQIALELVEVDELQLYRADGLRCRDTAQYAGWVYGLAPAHTQEVLRIGRKLLDLPEIDRAFCAGWLTWEHVLLLTRVAVPRHEFAWLLLALEVPLEDLARVVRRGVEGWAPPPAGDPQTRVGGARLGWIRETLEAKSWRRRAPGGSDVRHRESARPRWSASERRRGPWASAVGRGRGAPNVRHTSGSPPSTS